MAIVNGYVTLPEFKRWLRLDEPTSVHPDDELFEAAINGTCRWIDAKCKRHFYQVTEARDFRASDGYNLDLGHYNDLVSVTSLTTDDDGDGVFETAWVQGTDFELRPRNVEAAPEEKPFRSVRSIGRSFPINAVAGGRLERIRILGTWGWPAIPGGIRQAAIMQASRIWKRKEAPEGIMGMGQFGVVRVSGRGDPDVMALLRPYQLRSVG